jgi:predicted dehydrogenase
MAMAESVRHDGIEVVSIVTPNHLHAAVARAFLEAGIHVICDKPVTTTSADARMLRDLAQEKGLLFAVTHNYSANAMVRQAREMVQEGRLGDVRIVQVEYAQDWLVEPIELAGQKQAAWRTDPALAGGGAIGDIGSHAWQLADFVTGMEIDSLCADLAMLVPGRRIDDNVHVMLRYANGARGSLWASQVAPGHGNDLSIRVYGSRGSLRWRQERPDELQWTVSGEPTRTISRNGPGTLPSAARLARVPYGHPEGYLEAFGNLYREFAACLHARKAGTEPCDRAATYPDIEDGLRAVQFVEAVQASAQAGGVWLKPDTVA